MSQILLYINLNDSLLYQYNLILFSEEGGGKGFLSIIPREILLESSYICG